MNEVYFEDLLQEIKRLDSENPEGFTTREMARAMDRSTAWCRQQVRELIDRGKVEFNGRRKVEQADKKVGYLPVYKIVAGG